MERNVLWIAGVNGVGKSRLVRELRGLFPNTEVVTCSGTLMRVFEVTSREALALLDEKEKAQRLEEAVYSTFRSDQGVSMIVFDTHLVVPIRVGCVTKMEYQWFPSHSSFIKLAVLLTAEPKIILERRMNDYRETGRERDLNLNNIGFDQLLNQEAFQQLVVPTVSSLVLDTSSMTPTEMAHVIIERWS